jgi:hypothetical protein
VKRLTVVVARNLRPGGWAEFHEIDSLATSDDDTVDGKHPLNILFRLMESRWAVTFGWDIRIIGKVPEMLQQAGFVNIQIRHNRIPVGRWHHESRMREMGMFSQTIAQDWSTAVLTKHDSLGLSEEQADTMFEEITDKLNDVSVHCLLDWVDVWAQKPA